MVFSKKFDYRKRTQERDLFFGLPSTPFLVFLSFIAILLIFNLIITNSSITGNVINDVNLTYKVYEPGEKLTGSFSLDFSQGDLIPKDSKIQVLISSPACALYYVCSDGSLSEWYSYLYTRDTPCISKTSEPWKTCPDGSKFEGECKKMGYTCCDIGYGQGLYYGNLGGCSKSQQCFDRCANLSNGGIKNVTLEQFIQSYNRPTPYAYYGNLTTGAYNNVNGLEPLGIGEGFAACSNSLSSPRNEGEPVTLKAIQNFPTGNAIVADDKGSPVPQIPIGDVDLIPMDASYDYPSKTLTFTIVNKGGDGTDNFRVSTYDITPKTPVLLDEQKLEGLDSGGEIGVSFISSYSLAQRTVLISVDPDNNVKETDEKNNNLTYEISAAPIPADLIIDGIYYDYSTNQLSASIRNIGGSPAQNFYVQACKMVSAVMPPVQADVITGTQTCSILTAQQVSMIFPNSGARIIFGTFDLQGSTIKVKADSTNAVPESNELNNENTTILPSLSELPDIEVLSSSYDCRAKTLLVTLTNNGKNPTGNFALALCTNYSEVYQVDLTGKAITGMAAAPNQNLRCSQRLIPVDTTVESIEGGEAIEVEITSSALDGASFTIDANPGRSILESTYANNRLSASLPKLPDFEVLSGINYSSINNGRLDFKIRNNGQVQGTSEITICEMITKRICGYELQETAFAISNFPLTGDAIAQPGCRYVTTCENIITPSSMTFTLGAGATGSFSVSGVKGKSLKIIVDQDNAVCETNENNNQQAWDYNGGTCSGNDDPFIQDSCSGTYYQTSLNDTCINSTHLTEYSCSTPECISSTIYCEGGCNSTTSACNQLVVPQCFETDAGDDKSHFGTCTGKDGIIYSDSCTNTGLLEYYCNTGAICASKNYLFSTSCVSCQSGACSNNTYSCTGWNNEYSLKLNAPPLNLVTPNLDLGYFLLDISLVSSDGTLMSSALGDFMNNDTSYRYCADYQCKRGYGINIPDECDSNSDCGTTGPGGGTGGEDPTACYDDWNCGTWSSCNAEGSRTRQCTRCTMSNTESEVCVYGCIEDWACSDWTVCDESGAQSQICTDKNTCSARNSEYVAKRDCCVENWDCKWGTCQNGKQARVCTDNSNCGTGFLKPTDESRECSGGFGIDLSSIPLGVKIAVPIAIIGGVLVSLFLIRRKPSGEIIKTGSKSTIQKIAQPAKANYPELTSYIKTAKGQGMNDNDIKKKLLDAGWPKDVVDSGFK